MEVVAEQELGPHPGLDCSWRDFPEAGRTGRTGCSHPAGTSLQPAPGSPLPTQHSSIPKLSSLLRLALGSPDFGQGWSTSGMSFTYHGTASQAVS